MTRFIFNQNNVMWIILFLISCQVYNDEITIQLSCLTTIYLHWQASERLGWLERNSRRSRTWGANQKMIGSWLTVSHDDWLVFMRTGTFLALGELRCIFLAAKMLIWQLRRFVLTAKTFISQLKRVFTGSEGVFLT